MLAALLSGGRVLFGPSRGMQAEYFTGERGVQQPDLTSVDAQPSTRQILDRWQTAAPDVFTVRWVGYLAVPRAGRYTFRTTSDDGSMLSVDGRVLVDNGGRHGPQTASADIELEPGSHLIIVDYTQQEGTFSLDVEWARDGGRFSPLPYWALTPARTSVSRVLTARAADMTAWTLLAFAIAAVGVSGWRSRWPLAHPRTGALLLFVAMAVLQTWPLVTDIAHLARNDNRDTVLNEWILAWVAHQAVHAPLDLFNGNIFYPERYSLAFSEAMLVQSALGAPLLWLGASPVLTYNVLLLAGLVLNGWVMSLVIRRWTGDWTAGLVSGMLFAFCSHALTRIPHMQAQHVEFLPLALLALDELLRRPTVRQAVKVALLCVLQSLTSIYLLAATIFAMAAAVLARPRDWTGRRAAPAITALAVVAIVSAALLAPMLLIYYRASQDQGLVRSLVDATRYSATWSNYLLTPARVHLWWSARFAGGTGLFPGVIGLLLTMVALARGTAIKDPRARMCLVMGLVGMALSFGPKMPGYGILYATVPVLQGVRATARFGYLATVAVAMLAGFGVIALRAMVPARSWPALAIVLVAASGLESMAAPLGLSRYQGIAPIYDRVPRGPGVVVVEFPFFGPGSAQFHANYMLNSTRNWQPLVNGYSGFQPGSYYRHVQSLQTFPDAPAITALRQIGVTHVFVHRTRLGPDQLAQLAARPELKRVDRFGETELYEVVGK